MLIYVSCPQTDAKDLKLKTMYTIEEITKIIANCQDEDDLLIVLLSINKYKKSFCLIDLFLIDTIARQKILILNK